LKAAGFEAVYIGSHSGIERKLAEAEGLPFYAVSTGKMRRYLNPRAVTANVKDMFRVGKGLGEARRLMKELKPGIVFSKGGFVSVPVVIAASREGVPVVIHESDLTPGLANKIAYPFAKMICATFEDTLAHLPKKKGVLTGTPIRGELLTGDAFEGRRFLGFGADKPILLVTGGSSGSVTVNGAVDKALEGLLKQFNVVHLRGKGNLSEIRHIGYTQYEFLNKEMPNVLAASDIVVSRAGSNTINELLYLKKPNLLIPLSKKASRGDQIMNARAFERRGYSMVLAEEELTAEMLAAKVNELYLNRNNFIYEMQKSRRLDSVSEIVALLNKLYREAAVY
jgi:UDP-N-acetylglucosamine--N-acetylmuramyl-(pentapeptide) pyrophosphoryl-undecaprenol N-acetylglucosamine transferase